MRISDWSSDVCSSDLYSDAKQREACLASADPGKPGVEGKFVPPGLNPGKAVHMMDIHAEKGMQCADCHFAQDSHGNGYIQGEVANAVELSCKDCHGTADAYPNLLTSNVAARPQGRSEERRVGKECVSTCRSQWSP